ncbi:hypothetical protein NKL07_01620 [Mesorhizobium sp. C280B]|uniref:hypothetical protein n=1 Tax=unclassified Mesorhizobium TaxID=325217 RepID=UPI0003CE5966|nr:hypothetical protein [Mesorhizobium sp. LSJC280B00]ESW64737.1 hypothetical protein X772_35805 [Mesorhizobium sp. LSJC280B00]
MAAGRAEAWAEAEAVPPLSEPGAEIQAYVRKPIGYNRAFLESYRPNESFYLTAAERAHLREVTKTELLCTPFFKRQKTAIPDCPLWCDTGFARQFGLDPLIFEVAVANLIGSATHDLLGGQYAAPDEAANLNACETAANPRDCSIKRSI